MREPTLKIWNPPRPTRFMASASRVIPSAVMLPFIQCHQVLGRADAGGRRKPSARSPGPAGPAACDSRAANVTAAQLFKNVRLCMDVTILQRYAGQLAGGRRAGSSRCPNVLLNTASNGASLGYTSSNMRTILLVLSVCVALAQDAEMSGLIRDSSEALVPGAQVSVVNEQTGAHRSTVSNTSGIYSLPSLESWPLQDHRRGEGIRDQRARRSRPGGGAEGAIDFVLKVGDAKQSVTVQADASPLNITDSSLSTVVDRQFVENLPLNGRSFQNLFQLTPGVVVATTSFYDQGQFNVNGQRGDANYFTVDGVSANFGINGGPLGQSGGGALPALTPEEASMAWLRWTRFRSSAFRPPLSRPNMAARRALRSKSRRAPGRMQFHGTLFDYFRNDKLDANDWFANQQSKPKPEERQNDFGGVLGGPIREEPHLLFLFLRRTPAAPAAGSDRAGSRSGNARFHRRRGSTTDSGGISPSERSRTGRRSSAVFVQLLEPHDAQRNQHTHRS